MIDNTATQIIKSVRAVKNKHAPEATEQWLSEFDNKIAVGSEKYENFEDKDQKELILKQQSEIEAIRAENTQLRSQLLEPEEGISVTWKDRVQKL